MSAVYDQQRDAFLATRPPMVKVAYDHAAHRRALYEQSPEFHYAVRAAMEAPTDAEVVRRLLDVLAQTSQTLLSIREERMLDAMTKPPQPILILDGLDATGRHTFTIDDDAQPE